MSVFASAILIFICISLRVRTDTLLKEKPAAVLYLTPRQVFVLFLPPFSIVLVVVFVLCSAIMALTSGNFNALRVMTEVEEEVSAGNVASSSNQDLEIIETQSPSSLSSPSPSPTPTGTSTPLQTRHEKYELLTKYMYNHCSTSPWFISGSERIDSKSMVYLRIGDTDTGITFPTVSSSTDQHLVQKLLQMEFRVVIMIGSNTIDDILKSAGNNVSEIALNGNLKIQVIDTVNNLTRVRKNQRAAFVQDIKSFIIWEDEIDNALSTFHTFEKAILAAVVDTGLVHSPIVSHGSGSSTPSTTAPSPQLSHQTSYVGSIWGNASNTEAQPLNTRRKRVYWNPIMVSITVALIFIVLSFGLRKNIAKLIIEPTDYWRYVIFLLIPLTVPIFYFPATIVVGAFLLILGPTKQNAENHRDFSAQPPNRLMQMNNLPAMTVICPVYKEGLVSVIAPTIQSVLAAMKTYERQGGVVNMIICDDGMQLISEQDRLDRQRYYKLYDVGWVARPAHSATFIRAGRFKKASNMNFTFALSLKVEEMLEQIERTEKWSAEDEVAAYDECLERAIKEDGNAWATGDIRIGDYILMIDSDTEIPEDCFLDAAIEMTECPDVGIIQHASGVMQVSHDFFENAMTFLTDCIYASISASVAFGDAACFVGHNAFLRWSALQEVAVVKDGRPVIFSESHVSEDFDISLRLRIAGYVIRFATYSNGGFKEGVSLTLQDEISRWQKYAWGCSELLFNPGLSFFTKGPLSPLCKRFLCSNIGLTHKLSILGYISTYYAFLAGNFRLLLYILTGFFPEEALDLFSAPLDFLLTTMVLFAGLGQIALVIHLFRIGKNTLIGALSRAIKWIPFFLVFFTVLTFPIGITLCAHPFNISMSWAATGKEVVRTNFFVEFPKIFKRFRLLLIWSILNLAVLIVLMFFTPVTWRIDDVFYIAPTVYVLLCSILGPFLLNPALMKFTF